MRAPRWAGASTTFLAAVFLVVFQTTSGHDEFGGAAPSPREGFDYEWRQGRSTWYGGETDPWSIHQGHCYYSYLAWDIKTGWDVAALSDQWYNLGWRGLCGRCFEVQCRNAWITDGYGQSLDRTSVCYDNVASVVVQITDKCPCQYPDNSYSNRRWCCGDQPHMDLSKWAFEKLAPTGKGVIGINYREVPCDHLPWKKAQLPAGQDPSAGVRPPTDWNPWRDDPRPWP